MSAQPIERHAIKQVCFGPFRLLPRQRLLLLRDKPVQLGSRALDILSVLVERAGELVPKGELMGRIWPEAIRHADAAERHAEPIRADGSARRSALPRRNP